VEAARPARVGPGEGDGLVQRLGVLDFPQAPRPRARIDDPALPADSAENGPGAQGPREVRGGQRSDDVTAAADAQAQDAAGGAERGVDPGYAITGVASDAIASISSAAR
jgi:hypothetical protein